MEVTARSYSPEVQIVCFSILRTGCSGQRSSKQRYLESLDHSTGNVVLHFEYVVEWSVIGLRPYVVAVIGANQLRCHSEGVPRFAYTSLEHVCNPKGVGDILNGGRLALKIESGSSRRNPQIGDFCQHIDELFRHPVG